MSPKVSFDKTMKATNKKRKLKRESSPFPFDQLENSDTDATEESEYEDDQDYNDIEKGIEDMLDETESESESEEDEDDEDEDDKQPEPDVISKKSQSKLRPDVKKNTKNGNLNTNNKSYAPKSTTNRKPRMKIIKNEEAGEKEIGMPNKKKPRKITKQAPKKPPARGVQTMTGGSRRGKRTPNVNTNNNVVGTSDSLDRTHSSYAHMVPGILRDGQLIANDVYNRFISTRIDQMYLTDVPGISQLYKTRIRRELNIDTPSQLLDEYMQRRDPRSFIEWLKNSVKMDDIFAKEIHAALRDYTEIMDFI